VRRLADTLNGMLDRLEAGGTRQRAFVADAAHELRSPLAAVRTTLEVALVHPDPEGVEPTLRTALEETVRLGRLVDDLLLLARLDAAAPRPLARVDVGQLVADVVPGLAPHAQLALQPAVVLGDRDGLVRVVRNLVENASRHAVAHVRVTVADGEQVALQVDDDGPGIPASERERVFDRFYRVDTPRSRAAGGAGLGLAIVHELVTSMGGTVVAEDSPAGGSRFSVRFPAA
jgi:signal transduction histidine kinase